MENNSDKQAFPRSGYEQTNLADHAHYEHVDGLTKREYLAAMALNGIIASGKTHQVEVAQFAIIIADELLKQLAVLPSPLTPS